MKSPFAIFGIIAASILIVWGVNFGLTYYLLTDWTPRGQFGDSFGSVNSLFTGLAFAGVLVTIWMQRDELALQRTELRLQREEMAKSTEVIARQGRVQRAALNATLCQARIAALEADIRAHEIGLSASRAGRNDAASKKHQETIQRIANQMRSEIPGVEKRILGLDAYMDLESPPIL